MLTKSVKSVISVVLKHVARAKKIRAISAIREHNIRMVSPDSSLCQNGKQVEIITKMIFELCYIEVIIVGLYGDMRKLPIAWHLHMLSGVTLIGVVMFRF